MQTMHNVQSKQPNNDTSLATDFIARF